MSQSKTNLPLVIVGLMLGMLLSALDQTIMATAMPTVVEDLGGFTYYSWVFSIYMLTSTTSMPIFGKLADLYGRKRMYMIGMGLFILGSALSGLSQNMTELIVFRGIQGLGAGALMPLAITIIGDVVSLEQRGKMQGMFGGVMTIASIIGPAIGGLFVDHLSWHWVFYINLPFGIAAMVILGIALHENVSKKKRSIDWLGAITLSGSIISILLALVLGGNTESPGTHYAWGSGQIIGLMAIGAVLLAAFLWIQTKVKEPLIPLHLFRKRTIAVASLVGFFSTVGLFGAITYIPLFVQGVIGVKASIAGYILTPMMLAVVFTAVVGGRFLNRFSYRTFIVTGMVLMAAGFALFATMDVETTNLQVSLYMVLTGLGMGLIMPTLNTAVIGAVGPEQRGIVSSLPQFFRSIGGTIGVSIMGVVMTNRLTAEMPSVAKKFASVPADQLKAFLNPQALLDKAARAKIPADLLLELQKAFSHGVTGVFLTGIIAIAIGFGCSLFMGGDRMLKPVAGQPEEKGAAAASSASAMH